MCSTDMFLKLINGLFNISFGIVGLALAAYGAFSSYTLIIINTSDTIKEHLTIVPSLITLKLGILLIILVFLGCCAVCREITCCLHTYSVFLILLAVTHICLGTYCLIYYGSEVNSIALQKRINDDITYAVEHYRTDPHTMDDIQRWLKCCGKEIASEDYPFYESELPPSCCDESITCLKYSPDRYKEGCAQQVFYFTIGTNYYLGWISLVVGITELIAALLGICFSCFISKNQMATFS